MNEKEILSVVRSSYGDAYEIHEERIMAAVHQLMAERDTAVEARDKAYEETYDHAVTIRDLERERDRLREERDSAEETREKYGNELLGVRAERDVAIAGYVELREERDRLLAALNGE